MTVELRHPTVHIWAPKYEYPPADGCTLCRRFGLQCTVWASETGGRVVLCFDCLRRVRDDRT